jgi:uncharacterized protein YciI
MPLFVLTGLDKPNALELRMATREAHLAYVRDNLGIIKVAGPVLDAAGEMAGSLFIIEAETAEAVEAFSAADPYRKAGLFGQVTILPWKMTVGGFA